MQMIVMWTNLLHWSKIKMKREKEQINNFLEILGIFLVHPLVFENYVMFLFLSNMMTFTLFPRTIWFLLPGCLCHKKLLPHDKPQWMSFPIFVKR